MSLGPMRKWLLPVSLAINVFLGAAVVTHFLHHRPLHPPGPPDPVEMAEHMAESLPPADALVLRQAFAARAPTMREILLGDAAFHSRLRTVLEAPEFDAAAMRATLADADKVHVAFGEAMGAAMIDAAGKMSPEGRRKLARGGGHPPP